MTHYVCGFYFANDEVLLINKLKPDWQKGKLNGVGGKVEKDESSIDAMIREFKEETGGVTNQSRWKLFVRFWYQGGCVSFFFMNGLKFEFVVEKEMPQWVKINELPLNVIPNLRWLIPMCFDHSLEFPINMFSRNL